jgi:hypothetical protein
MLVTTLHQLQSRRFVLGILAASGLVACGGGGSSSPASPPASTPTTAAYSAVGSYPTTDCVKSNATGLVWEGKPASGLRAGTALFTHYDSITVAQVAQNGSYVVATQAQLDAASNSAAYVKAVNASSLCGYTDWRLPTSTDLKTLVQVKPTTTSATIDSDWFPNTPAYLYWTASAYSDAKYAWVVDFFDGNLVVSGHRGTPSHVRLVRQ